MSSNWTSSLKLELIGTGEQAGTWGQTTNDNFQYALEQAIVGTTNVAFSSADVDLTLTDSNSSQTARFLRLNLTGTSAGARTLYLSTGANVQKTYIVNNNLLDTITVQNKIGGTGSGTSVAVPSGKTMWIYNTGTNVVEVVSHLGSLTLSTALPVASGGTGGTTQSAARTGLGATTVGGNFFTLTNPSAVTFPRINADNSISTLDAATFRTAIGAGAGTVTSVGGTGTVNGLTLTGTVTSSGSLTLGGTLTISNADWSGTDLSVANGGTGASTFTANNVLLGNGTSSFQTVAPGANGNILTSNGTTWTSAPAGGVTSFSAGTTGLTPNTGTTGAVTLSGELSASNGGTGRNSLTANNVLIGNGTSQVNFVAPSTSGNALVSNGTTWSSGSPAKLSTASGSAPSYSARAWVNFDGTNAFSPNPSTTAIRASGNVSSITDNGTGSYTINFTTAMPDVNYVMVAAAANVGAEFGAYVLDNSTLISRTTSSISIYTTTYAQLFDASFVNVVIFR